jgi:hypothetical protein
MDLREFRSAVIPEELKNAVSKRLATIAERSADPVQESEEFFDEIKMTLEAMYYGKR